MEPFASGCAALIISLSTSGGIAGFGLPGKERTIESDTLEPGLRQQVCARFDPKALAKLARTLSTPPGAADTVTLHVTVTDDSGTRHRFDLPESDLPPALLDLIDEL